MTFTTDTAQTAEGRDRETARIRRTFDKSASKYDKEMTRLERLLFKGGREWVCRQAKGDVLEIAFGTGRNLPFYGADVRITGIELSPAMLAIGRQRAAALGLGVDLRVGDAHDLEFPDERFDTVVCTLSLCTIPDDRRAVSEARRVLKPRGKLLLLEHVRSPSLPVRVVQRVIDPLAVRFGGDHLLREPLDYLGEHGFDVEQVERSKWGFVERVAARRRP